MRLYDTATKVIRDFVPITPGHVGIYHCGLTVQGPPHIGHIRKEVVFDVLRRWFEHGGMTVTLIANVTDIDDKILAKGEKSGEPWWSIAYANERELHNAYEVLLYTSDAADDLTRVDLGGRRIIKKKKKKKK